MTASLPKKLARPPLIESVFELRFEPTQDKAADLLIGLLFSGLPKFRKVFQSLPISAVPREIRDKDPNTRFFASHKLSGDNRQHVMVGDRVLAFSQTAPYPGWEIVKPGIEEMLAVMKETGFVKRVERYSLKAVNLLQVPDGDQLKTLNARFEIAGRKAQEEGFRFRTEFVEKALITIIDIATRASLSLEGGTKLSGLLIQLDTIKTSDFERIWHETGECLEELRGQLKPLFFGLLTEETTSALGPSYE